MPQSGSSVSVEAVDPVFQTKMIDLLKQTNRYAELHCLNVMKLCGYFTALKWWLAGTTLTQASVAGSRESTSIHNRCGSSSAYLLLCACSVSFVLVLALALSHLCVLCFSCCLPLCAEF